MTKYIKTLGLLAAYDAAASLRAKTQMANIAAAVCTDAAGKPLDTPRVYGEDGRLDPRLHKLFARKHQSERSATLTANNQMPHTLPTQRSYDLFLEKF